MALAPAALFVAPNMHVQLARFHSSRLKADSENWRMQFISMGENILYGSVPMFIAMAVFGVYAGTGHHLTADVAFPALWFIYMLHGPMMELPMTIMHLVTARVSLRRFQQLADAGEYVGEASRPSYSVCM